MKLGRGGSIYSSSNSRVRSYPFFYSNNSPFLASCFAVLLIIVQSLGIPLQNEAREFRRDMCVHSKLERRELILIGYR